MKRPGDKRLPGGKAGRRRRLFEQSRGLFGRRALPVDEQGTVAKTDLPEPPPEDERDAERDEP